MFNSVVFLHRTVSSGLWRVVGCSLYLVSFLKRIESELFYFVSIQHTETVMFKKNYIITYMPTWRLLLRPFLLAIIGPSWPSVSSPSPNKPWLI